MRDRVGQHRLLRRVGVGGMGEVYEAVDERRGRRVAVKVLQPRLAGDPRVVERFVNEARAIARVRHPSLVEIYEHGRLDDGTLYIAMEYLEGETLAERLRRGPIAQELVLRLGRQIAAALAAAHARGIVHRDLKPDNVMLVEDRGLAGGVRAKVLDFGIAKIVAAGGEPALHLTVAGLILGTPQYISPEQCRARDDVDGKADVYALGVVLFEALSGRPPFKSDSEWELLAMHLKAPPPPLPPTVSAELAKLVASMLHKEPRRRPSMTDVTARLPVPSAPARVAGLARRRCPARSGLLFVFACAAVSVLLTILISRL